MTTSGTPDVVIVGSGFGGAVAACRLATAGKRVLMLERGRKWRTEDTPAESGKNWFYDPKNPLERDGWMDVRRLDGDMTVVCGAGVGGGSLIYANVCIDADSKVFESGWPSAINGAVLAPYYERVSTMLSPQRVPADRPVSRMNLLQEAAVAIGEGARFERLELAVDFASCTFCGNCDIGCATGAKKTLDLNYLAKAQTNDQTEIRAHCQVSHISEASGGWRVHYVDYSSGKAVPSEIVAPRLILAAGSIGSTEILLRSRQRGLTTLPRALGRGWSSNGDFVTPAKYKSRSPQPTNGPTITSAISFLDGYPPARFFIEDGGIPNLANVIFEADTKPGRFWAWLSRRGGFGSVMPWFGQAIDAADGDFYLGRSWLRPWRTAMKLNWNPARSEQAIDAMEEMHVRLSKATGGYPIRLPSWGLFKGLVTPHPLGGCNMAASPAAGVVDDVGKVFGHQGLYVMDGAIVPRAIGRNPSKTIAALAERAVEALLADM